MRREAVTADVLIVGGGIAGLMAAIKSAELGAKVVVAEKANTMRSGAGATGNDHFMSFIPEYHGPDIEPWIDQTPMIQERGNIRSRRFVRNLLEKSFDIVTLWDSWGIPMRPTGKWECTGHAIPGLPNMASLKYAGQNQKPILTREARNRGVDIFNRVTVFDLIRDQGAVVGAIGTGTRDEMVVIFQARSVVLTTGICTRLYPGPTPGWTFNMADPPSTTGKGRAMAYRAGAELVNMEMPRRWAGPKYFARCGKGTWIGIIRDPEDKPIGPYVTQPDRRYGDIVGDQYPSLFEERMCDGRGPVYMDCRGISDEDYAYMRWGFINEGNSATIDYLNKTDIDITKTPVEFMTYELSTRGGIRFNEKGETSLKGLYAAGDEYFGGIGGAAIVGWFAGENAGQYSLDSQNCDLAGLSSQIEEKAMLPEMIRNRENGATWQEVAAALTQTMHDYAGVVKSDSLLRAGLHHLMRLRNMAHKEIAAKNQHELMHCLEVLNSFDVGESVFLSALERKETRDAFVRSDYPFTNKQFDGKVIICKRVFGQPQTEWKPLREEN